VKLAFFPSQTRSKQQEEFWWSTHFAGLDRKRSKSFGFIEYFERRETTAGWLDSLQVQVYARLDELEVERTSFFSSCELRMKMPQRGEIFNVRMSMPT
jgi:hypothetical protein